MNTTLIIMAAGIGSRYGKGIKQLAKIGPHDEIIMDYSIYDALEAGFNKVVFIIRKDIEKEFKEVIGNRIEKHIQVEYVFQEINNIPEGCTVPEVESNLGELDKLFYLVKESLMNHLSLSMLMIIMEKLLLKSFMIF